jgi:hypothetical protein
LLPDSYSAHRTNKVKRIAARIGVTLHHIPPGPTDGFEPLDRNVFGVLKAQGKRAFHA